MTPRTQHGSVGSGRRDDAFRIVPDHGPILVVDDDPEVCEVMQSVIEAAGYEVMIAGNGEEALDLIHEQRPSLIFLDIEMPVMDGAEFRQHQRHDPSLLRIPTIVMTGSELEPLLDLAVGETLRKPARLADILAAVRRYCIPGPGSV